MAGLEQISIKLNGIGHALADNTLTVPVYQRSYAWEAQHVLDLFQDLGTAIHEKEPEYFLGSIVVTRQKDVLPEVVDGQQRLATATILLAAIRDYLSSTKEVDRAQRVENTYLFNRDLRTMEVKPKLRLNETDNDFFQKKVLAQPDSADRKVQATKGSHERIARAAEIAKEHVLSIVKQTNKPIDRLVDWVEFIDKSAKVIWVEVPDYTNAFTIFETLNDRGLDLAISDLLKNYLFHLAGDRITEVQQRWVTMVGTLEAVDSENLVVTYIRHLWSSANGLTREKELYDRIKKGITSKQAAIEFAGALTEGARLYAAVLNPDHDLWQSYGATMKNHIETLNLLGMIQMRPLLLAILQKFSQDEAVKAVRLLVSVAVRFLIYGGLGGGTLESHFTGRAKDITDGKIKLAKELKQAMQDVVPSDAQFHAAFQTANVSKSILARYYLRALELQAEGADQPELVPNPNDRALNLEHILPQTPSEEWKVDKEFVKTYSNKIGNLALLQTKINVKAGNDGFANKAKHYAESKLKLTASLTKYKNWGQAEINERQKELADLAVKTWPYKA